MKNPGLILSASLLLSSLSLFAEETTKNPDGTLRSRETIEDVANNKSLLPNDNHVTPNTNTARFPEAEAKKVQKQIDRSKMTKEQLEQEKKMLNRVSQTTVNTPNLTERKSFSRGN